AMGADGEALSAGLTWAGTFHAVGARLLRDYAALIGLDPGFTIHDREDSADLMNLARQELGLASRESRFPTKGTCLAIYSRVVNAQAELAEVLRAVFADDGITVIEDRAATVRDDAGQVVVSTRSGQRASGARLLVATGRTPRTPELGLDAAGVKTDDRGFVLVDEAQRSSNPRIYAAGDVAGSPQYVYVAAATGRAAALNAT
ncbi:FAD-dependent oxidoreductase, partial [Actinomadura sp. DSM 109109]|nr:FAD-dependent oxidoreductase [Actinomadura lepetitiana]